MRGLGFAVASAVVSLAACETDSPRHIAETLPDVTCTVEGTGERRTSAEVRLRVPRAGTATTEVSGLTFSAEYAGPSGDRYLEVVVSDHGRVAERVRYDVPGGGRLRNQFGEARDAITGDHAVTSRAGGRLTWRCAVAE